MDTPTWQAGPDGRYCARCQAHRNLHSLVGRLCPVEYRPDTLADARRALEDARGDPAAEFVARGDVQRLGGNPDQPGTAAGWAGPVPHDPADPDGDP